MSERNAIRQHAVGIALTILSSEAGWRPKHFEHWCDRLGNLEHIVIPETNIESLHSPSDSGSEASGDGGGGSDLDPPPSHVSSDSGGGGSEDDPPPVPPPIPPVPEFPEPNDPPPVPEFPPAPPELPVPNALQVISDNLVATGGVR